MTQPPREHDRSDGPDKIRALGLSSSDARDMTEELARLAKSGLPLDKGLRAAAEEVRGSRLAKQLRHTAAQIEQGKPLEDILASKQSPLPPHLRRIFTTAIQSGELGKVLAETMEHQRRCGDLWRTLRLVVSYPLTLFAFALALVILLFAYVVPQFGEIYESFGIQIPNSTVNLIWMSREGLNSLLRCGATLAIAIALIRLVIGRARFRRIVWNIPVFGLLIQWTGTSEFTRLMSVLLRQGVPLTEALRLCAKGVQDAHVSFAANDLARRTDGGQTFSAALMESPQLPASMIPVVRWGEQQNQLPEAMCAASEMFEGRVQLRTSWLESVFPALMFVFIGGFVLFSILPGLFLPLVDLIVNLSA